MTQRCKQGEHVAGPASGRFRCRRLSSGRENLDAGKDQKHQHEPEQGQEPAVAPGTTMTTRDAATKPISSDMGSLQRVLEPGWTAQGKRQHGHLICRPDTRAEPIATIWTDFLADFGTLKAWTPLAARLFDVRHLLWDPRGRTGSLPLEGRVLLAAVEEN